MFVDQVDVTLLAGGGGNGCSSFRKEKNVPRGGPDGGRGGDGGSIYLRSDAGVKSLAFYRFHPILKAKRGAHGQGGNRHGKRGEDLILKVPMGTVVRKPGKDEEIFDFVKAGQSFLAAEGGKGGRGNASFASSTHQAPREFEEGLPGEEKEYVLELKLIADVGLVGLPNSGKSTLISRISAAKPRVAGYPFTTLVPHLGVVDINEFTSFVVADIPGLIEGAHKGQGLGTRFLKHIERTKILVHLVDVSPEPKRDALKDYYTLRNELERFNPSLIEKPHVIIANKIDLIDKMNEELRKLETFAGKEEVPFHSISALKGEGLKELVNILYRLIRIDEGEES